MAQLGLCMPKHQMVNRWPRGHNARNAMSCGATAKTDKKLMALVSKARSVRNGSCSSDAGNQEVKTSVVCALEVERAVKIMSEKDMRKVAKVNRIPRGMLKALPAFEVPTETGGTEVVYAFKDEDAQERKAKIKVISSTSLSHWDMTKQNALYSSQGQETYAHAATENGKKLGYWGFLEKESAGHISLQSWNDFLEQKLMSKHVGDDQFDGDADDGADLDEEDLLLVGPAAELQLEKPFITPPSKKAGNNINRGASSNSLGGGMPGRDGFTERGSAMGDSVVSEDYDGEQGKWGNGPFNNVSLPGDQLQHWRERIPLHAVIEGKQDKRSITGLKRAADRMLAKPDEEVVGAELMQFHRQVLAATQLCPSSFIGCPTEEVMRICDLLVADDFPLPEGLQFRILMRRVGRLVSEACYYELLKVLNPRVTCAFDHLYPKLAGLHDEPRQKLALYKKVVFSELICKVIMKGQDGAASCLSMCQQCLKQSEEVD
eukprot:5796253-Amphidinium_carterae.5